MLYLPYLEFSIYVYIFIYINIYVNAYIHLYIFIHLNIYIYIYTFIYISGQVSVYLLPLLPQMKHLSSSMIYLNLEIVISLRWHEAFIFSSMTVAKVPLFLSFENMEVFVKVLRSTTKWKLQYLSSYLGSIKSLLSLSS